MSGGGSAAWGRPPAPSQATAAAEPPAAWGASKVQASTTTKSKGGLKNAFQVAQSEQAAADARRQSASTRMRQATASKAAQLASAPTTAVPSDMHTGKIANIRDDAGFGFIDWSGDDSHVYFKLTDFEGYADTLKAPTVGQKVSFKLVVARNGRTRAEQITVVVPAAPVLSSAERRQRRRAAAGKRGPALVLSAASAAPAAAPQPWLGGWIVSLLSAGDGLIKPQGSTEAPRASFNKSKTPGCPSNVTKGDAVKFRLSGDMRTIGARAEQVSLVSEMQAAPDGLPALPPPPSPTGSGGLAAALKSLSSGGAVSSSTSNASAASGGGRGPQRTGVGQPEKGRMCSIAEGRTAEAAAWLRKLAEDPEQILLERSALAGLMNRRDLLSSDAVHDGLLRLLATRQARGADGCRADKVYDDVKRSMWLVDASLLLGFTGRMALRDSPPVSESPPPDTHPSEMPLVWATKVLRYIVADPNVASAVLKPLVEGLRSAAEYMQPPPSQATAQAAAALAMRFAKREGTQLPAAKPPIRGIKMVAVAAPREGGGGSYAQARLPAVAPSHPDFTPAALAWAGAKLPVQLVGAPDDPLWQEGTDFRSLSVFPSAAEVLSPVPPPLRALTVQGAYTSAFAYLDAHFRLLREDCVAPIRAGIAAYLHEKRREAIVSAQYQYARHHGLPLTELPPPPAPLPASRDVHVYPGVKLVGLVPGRQQLVYRIQLGHEMRSSGVNWPRSKRLMYGSLLLLAMNDFGFKPLPGDGGDEVSDDTLLWATVQNRDEELIASKGQLDIAFQDGYEPRLHTLLQRLLQENTSAPEDDGDEDSAAAAEFGLLGTSSPVLKFTVVESSATYFEAYRHTLAALQSVDIDGFGRNTLFESLLRPPRVVLPPAYLTPHLQLKDRQQWVQTTTAQLSAGTAAAPPATQQSMGRFVPLPVLPGALAAYPSSPPPNPLLPGKFPDAFRFPGIMPQLSVFTGAHSLRVLQGRWPVVAEDETVGPAAPEHVPCQLDASQLDAFKLSLTRELALVQGPPGTGKTYVGLQVVRSLLQNVVPRLSARPILVVCYTNHALDQFLEGILEVTNNIVRLGSRSKSEVLRPFNLRERVFGLLDSHKGKAAKAAHARDTDAAAASVEAASAAASATLLHHRRGIMRQLRELRGHIHEACVSMGSRVLYREDTADAALLKQYKSLWDDFSQGEAEDQEHSDFEYEHLCSWLECSPLAVTDGPEGAAAAEQMLRASILAEEEAARAADAHHEAMRATKADAARLADARTGRQAANPLDGVSVVGGGRSRAARTRTGAGAKEGALLLKALQEGTPTDVSPAADDDEEVTRIQQDRQADGGEGGQDDDDAEEGTSAGSGAASRDAPSWEHATAGQKFKHLETAPSPIFPPPLSVNDSRGLYEVDAQHNSGSRREASSAARSRSFMCTADLESEPDVWRLPVFERRRLYRVWVWRRYRTAQNSLAEWCERYARVQRQLATLTRDLQLQILGRASVIGMTTTATAKYQNLIHALKPEIVIVEEAAEVLESHLVTALTSSVKQLIAIGDHQQLRPGTAVHELAKEKHLEVSLFERLVLNGVPHVTLSQQRRMRPEVSGLIRTLYPSLRDHQIVSGPARPHIRGMLHDVFFYDHTSPEGGGSGAGTSKQNVHEASMVAGLLSYLLGEGHTASSITVLSAYVGQLLLLKNHLRDMPAAQGVRLTTVDNYQGEENEIVLLSLVRSSLHGSIGFLAEDNRACVALSRARCGMYIFGNGTMLASRSQFWASVLRRLSAQQATGANIPITPGLDRNLEQGSLPEPLYVTRSEEFPW